MGKPDYNVIQATQQEDGVQAARPPMLAGKLAPNISTMIRVCGSEADGTWLRYGDTSAKEMAMALILGRTNTW